MFAGVTELHFLWPLEALSPTDIKSCFGAFVLCSTV